MLLMIEAIEDVEEGVIVRVQMLKDAKFADEDGIVA